MCTANVFIERGGLINIERGWSLAAKRYPPPLDFVTHDIDMR